MDEEHRGIRKLIEKNIILSEENNKILKNIRRWMRFGRLFSFFYWLIIIGGTVGAYYFIQPLFAPIVDFFTGTISGIGSAQQGVSDTGSGLQSFFKNLQ